MPQKERSFPAVLRMLCCLTAELRGRWEVLWLLRRCGCVCAWERGRCEELLLWRSDVKERMPMTLPAGREAATGGGLHDKHVHE